MHDQETINTFLRESNAIEGVYDEESLELAKQAWDIIVAESEMSTSIMLESHRILMQDKLWPNQIGCFRKCDVTVGGSKCVPYMKVPYKMSDWITNINESMKYPRSEKDNKRFSKKWHVKFERIHPFVDGNGRIGRMLMNWWRTMVGLPILVIPEKDKEKYYEWFKVVKI